MTRPPRRPLRVTFLTVMPTPYMQDLFAAMRTDGRLVPRVLYMEMAAPDTHWGDRPLPDGETVLPGRWVNVLGGRVHLNRGVTDALASEPADVFVVGGYSSLTAQRAMRWLHRTGRPWVFHGERPGMNRRGGVGSALRRWAMRPATAWPAGIAAVGERAAAAYRELAPPRCVVRNIPYVCDLEPFFAAGAAADRGNRTGTTFLYCGQLIERKGVDLLLDAFVNTAREVPGCRLRFVGTGPLRERLGAEVPPDLRDRVTFAGFKPVAELPAEFAAADAFVLPSRHDGWGVVVNQALAAGLPVIASDAVGAAELCRGIAGAVIESGSVTELTAALVRAVGKPPDRAATSAAARKVGAGAGVRCWTEFFNAVSTSARDPSP